ncbi:uncharacterized protein LOC132795059 isoform X7 [Drosophila nasuta]|uniref:uncharacterized protein LOC132795059 isoform X7 n=1 Tax=Drosophila nasuta TaxID=42062 RepID=UPI00295E779B|nr:uncharacterized protein LOC132795059 isoform X7 [Drosophila nasuta]
MIGIHSPKGIEIYISGISIYQKRIFKYFALMLTSAYTGQYLIFLVNQLYILLKTSKMPHILVNLQTDAE